MAVKQVTRLLISAFGLGLLAIGATKTVSASGDVGGVALVIGALLLVGPFIVDRVERIAVNSSGFEFYLSREISELGAPSTAKILDRTELTKFAESYAFIHEELDDPAYRDAKVHLQDLLVERAAAISKREKLNAHEVRILFKSGSPMMRVLALGLMQGDPALANGRTILSSIADSRSANEQFQGLRLALLGWYSLSGKNKRAIQEAIAYNPYIWLGKDRRLLANKLLALPVDGMAKEQRN